VAILARTATAPGAARHPPQGGHIPTGVHEIDAASQGPLARVLLAIARRTGLTPNGLTLIGFAGVCAVGVLIVTRQWVLAGFLYVAFSLGDSLDGTLARATGRASRFGAFLDSTLDRLAEGVILGALGITFALDGNGWAVGACFVALSASFLVSYSRARSEGLGIDSNKGGLTGRPERLVLTGAGIFLGSLGSVLEFTIVVLAALSLFTMLQRIWHIRGVLERAAPARAPTGACPGAGPGPPRGSGPAPEGQS
jgi:CDP-diacylglycerol--glycerol-3-phosphate 3-phosphatidyltransferase